VISQRRAVLDAAALAGLNVLRVMNETAAAALCWGLPKVSRELTCEDGGGGEKGRRGLGGGE
jgi:molecular chaperone DnaK (HSP70)